MPRNKRIPKPPKKPLFPPDQQIKQLERAYVKKNRLPRLRAAGKLSAAAAEQELQAEFRALFQRTNVRWKSYPATDHVIICEGDSWFYHPFLVDIPEQLLRFGYSVLHSNRPGKHLKESLDEGYFLAPLTDARKPQIRALLLSGGGNDLISWRKGNADFSPIFRKSNSDDPTDYIDESNLRKALGEVTGCLIDIATKLKRADAGELSVLLHCYDYITPKDYGPFPFKGEWINPQLDAIAPRKNTAFRKRITSELQRPWIAEYKAACDRLGWRFVETQNLVRNRWHDEIHPNNHGLYDIACEYWNELHKLGVLPSRKVTELATAA